MDVPAPSCAIILDEDFELEAPLRIVGLKSASHLNGKTGYATRFDGETRRYEVSLMHNSEIKSVKPANLEPLSVMDEVAAWALFLQRDGLVVGDGQVPMRRLEKLDMTIELLQQTNIGKVVNDFAKRFSESDVAAKARLLVTKWREFFSKSKQEARPKPSRRKPQPKKAATADGTERTERTEKTQKVKPSQGGPSSAGAVSAASAVPSSASSSPGPVPRPSTSTVKPMTSTADAKRLLEAMRAATTDEARLGTLAALDKSPKHCMLQFCQDGGLEILEKWLRLNPDARYSCLLVLQKLPVALPNLQKAKLIPAVIAIQQDVKANGEQAAAVLDRWRSAGFLMDEKVERTPPTSTEPLAWPPRKRPKFEQTRFPEPSTMEDLGDEPEAPQPQPHTPPLSDLPAARAEDIPSELRGLDPRVALVLMENSKMLQFLRKHPSVFQNMNSESLAYIGRNLRNAKDSLQEEGGGNATGCTVSWSIFRIRDCATRCVARGLQFFRPAHVLPGDNCQP